jgi:energy-coupling factor transporter transmembrane protein EcfT
MSQQPPDDLPLDPPEPRWPAIVASVVIGLLYLALPNSLSVGPRWLATICVFILVAATVITHRLGMGQLNHWFGHILSSVLTLFMVWSMTLLIMALPSNKEAPVRLLESAALLWVTNILVFALWYWRLDGGGPYERDIRMGHPRGAFLFPQMTEEGKDSWEAPEGTIWSPQFVDYLFLAFNTSTAFSPTDAAVLSRWAKVMMMIQSSISLAIIALLAARAVNILSGT